MRGVIVYPNASMFVIDRDARHVRFTGADEVQRVILCLESKQIDRAESVKDGESHVARKGLCR